MFADLAGALAGGRFYMHYFLTLTVSLSAAAGIAAMWIEEVVAPEAAGRLPAMLCALVVGPLAFSLALDVDLFQEARRQARLTSPVVARLRALSTPGDSLFVWSYQPQVYFQTDLEHVTRYPTAANIIDTAPDVIGSEILASLRANPPTFIVDSTTAVPSSNGGVAKYREFQRLLRQRYRLIGRFPLDRSAGFNELYRRRPAGL